MIKTDILIVGGSLSGLCAACIAKEENPELDITIVEKYTTGYAGKANRGAGIMMTLVGVDPEKYVEYHTRHNGEYLNDQEFLLEWAKGVAENVEYLDKWSNGKICKRPDGSYRFLKWRSQPIGKDEYGKIVFDDKDDFPWTLVAIDLDYMVNVRAYATKLGVKFVDRTGIVDVLKDGDRACGAIGYNIDDGSQVVFNSKAVMMATGSCNYRVMPMYSPCRGEGLQAVWRAGGKFRNCEMGSFYNFCSLENFQDSMGVEYALYNSDGENVGEQYATQFHSDIDSRCLAEFYRQARDGKGPLTYRIWENPLMPFLSQCCGSDAYFDRPFADRFWNNLTFNAFSIATNNEIVPGFVAEFEGVAVNQNFETTVPGLYGIGDLGNNGGCYHGATTTPNMVRGVGLANAQFSGRKGGRAAAEYVKTIDFGTISQEQIDEIDERFHRPLHQNGTVSVMEFLPEIQKVVQPLGNSLYRSEDRLLKALARIKELQEQTVNLKADDVHNLFGCNEIDAMLLCAELFFTAALERKESRGWALREDYPERGDDLYWVTVTKDENGKMVTGRERVPIERYKYKPED